MGLRSKAVQGPPCCRNDSVRGHGAPNADVMFIGIAPGADEWRNSKQPFTGPSGRELDKLLKAAGISREEQVYCTNLICWWKDAPDIADMDICAPRLREEIYTVRPRVIVTLGKLACERITGRKFKDARGAVIRGVAGLPNDTVVLSTYHPAAYLHRATTGVDKEIQIAAACCYARDMMKLADLDFLTKKWPAVEYQVINTVSLAQSLLDILDTSQSVALDIETNYDKEWEKAHPFDSEIVCIGVGQSDSFCYVLALKSEEWQLLRWPEARYVFHNGTFDTQEIAKATNRHIWLPVCEDTMLQSYSIDERSPKPNQPGAGLHKLKKLAREFVGSDFYEQDDHKILSKAAGDLTVEQAIQQEEQLAKLYEYNAKDVVYTHRLYSYLTSKQDDSDKWVYNNLLLPGTEVLCDSQYRGIAIDQEAMSKVFIQFITEFGKLQNKLDRWANDVIGDPQFNPRSHRQVKKLLEFQGYELANTQKATLLDLIDNNPDIDFVPDLLRYRTLDRMCNNYLIDIKREVKYDGRVHPHAFLIGTVTGRLTYKAPAVQTLPKPKTVKDLGIVRSIFTTTSDDYVIIEADYAQIEAWLGAYFSEDPELLADLQSSDWHSSVATGMFGKTAAQVEPWEWLHLRDAAKHINYGSMYGEEAKGLTRRPPIGIGCSLQVAQDYLNKWRAHYPTFVKYQKEQQRLAREQGYIETPFRRARRFPIICNDHQMRQAVNCKIQSTAGDYTLSSAIRLYKPLKALDTHLLLIEHDALYYEVARRHFEEAILTIREAMEAPPLPGLPSIKTEMDVGKNLAELYKKCNHCGEWEVLDNVCRACGTRSS